LEALIETCYRGMGAESEVIVCSLRTHLDDSLRAKVPAYSEEI